jgi:hypothetical protein
MLSRNKMMIGIFSTQFLEDSQEIDESHTIYSNLFQNRKGYGVINPDKLYFKKYY